METGDNTQNVYSAYLCLDEDSTYWPKKNSRLPYSGNTLHWPDPVVIVLTVIESEVMKSAYNRWSSSRARDPFYDTVTDSFLSSGLNYILRSLVSLKTQGVYNNGKLAEKTKTRNMNGDMWVLHNSRFRCPWGIDVNFSVFWGGGFVKLNNATPKFHQCCIVKTNENNFLSWYFGLAACGLRLSAVSADAVAAGPMDRSISCRTISTLSIRAVVTLESIALISRRQLIYTPLLCTSRNYDAKYTDKYDHIWLAHIRDEASIGLQYDISCVIIYA